MALLISSVKTELELLSNKVLTIVNIKEELAKANQQQFEISKTIKNNIVALDYVTESNNKNINEIFNSIQYLEISVDKADQMISKFKVDTSL
ncbi:MAG: hypothetical protein KDC52_06135 [Ignavibacteriae bacterium]|nr:hypothetical protein [Ignavibacteriota bacterium]MCB0746969.1 hypothetical protein [Ignavibacteriota bacterium]MCB0751034.1 hypothetical protein [Ignavibacteriota bacterium]MCB9250753.1 hypothetical protein [Ignavibacteriales bacterium]